MGWFECGVGSDDMPVYVKMCPYNFYLPDFEFVALDGEARLRKLI